MAVKASNQKTLTDMTDGFSVVLTNDNYTFLGTTTGVDGTQSTTCKIQALQGADEVACSVGSISTPTGLSIVSDGKTPIPTLTITATAALTTSGSVTIPVIVGEITINKVFSWSIAFKGATGATGNGIKSIAEHYAVSASNTTAPTSWSDTVPTMTTTNKYLWNYETVTYTSGATADTTKRVIGVYGDTGSTGSTGNGIKSITNYYLATGASSGVTPSTTGWTTAVQTVTATNKYLWNYEVITYTNSASTTTTPCIIGTYGDKGATGDKGDKGDTGAAGADALTLVITSSNGDIFKNTAIATTLTAHVYKAGAEVTGSALAALGTIKWYKDGGTTAVATGQTLTISAGDVDSKATYIAQLEG